MKPRTNSSGRSILVVLVVLAVLGAAGAFWWMTSRHETQEPISTAAPAPSVTAAPATKPESEERELAEPPPTRTAETTNSTTVAWPAKLELDLLQDASIPTETGVPALGAGRTARLKGILVGKNGQGVEGKVSFLFGFNSGRVLACNADGAFGATDLYPGLAIVRADGPGVIGSTREVLLRQLAETPLNIAFDFTAPCSGMVYGHPENAPLAGVQVELDGQHTVTNENGEFDFPHMTAGERLLLILKKSGYASYREIVGVAGGRPVPRDRYKYLLRPACSLQISVTASSGAGNEAQIFLGRGLVLGGRGELIGQRTYPWHLISPLDLVAGKSLTLDDLPEGSLDLRAFLPGAQAAPAVTQVNLVPGALQDAVLRFEPAPTLSVKVVGKDDFPVENATVTLEAPDRAAAELNLVSQGSFFLETEVMPFFPAAMQTARTDYQGRCILTAWDRVAPARYVHAVSADGKLSAMRIVRPSDHEVELKLEPKEAILGTLLVEFPGRHQGLPVQCSINGVPFAEEILPSTEPLRLENLPEGIWRLRASWNAQPLFKSPLDLKIRKETKTTIELPKGAIEGQDEETLKRAGRI